MENNNNGRGIFYGVIGVATLVVAIIGATFAYFSASVGKNDAINVASTVLSLRMQDMNSLLKRDLIPVDTVKKSTTERYDSNGDGKVDDTDEYKDVFVTDFYTFPGLDPQSKGKGAGTCADLNGNSICSVYTFTIKNPSETTAQEVVGSISFSGNTGFSNIKYAVFKGLASSITTYNVNDELKSTTATGATNGTLVARGSMPAKGVTEGTTQVWENTRETLAKEGTTSYTVLVWLEETGGDQNAEMGQKFSASILFSSPSGTGVTGVLTTG